MQSHISDYFLDSNDFENVKDMKIDSFNIIKTRNGHPNEKYMFHVLKYEQSYNNLKTYFSSIETRIPLNDPTILPLTGFSYNDEKFSIIEPYMENGSLEKLINECAKGVDVPNFETTRSIIIFGIAAGMAYLHQNNIIHQNLNCQNILLDSEMHPKIGGFKPNRYLYNRENLIDVMLPPRIVLSISPEMFKEEAITNRTDVYSYSIILYQLFKFQYPCDKNILRKFSLYMIEKDVTKGKRMEINEDEIPNKWADLIRQCWQNEQYERPRFIEIVKKLMDKKDEFFNDPKINQEELSRYIDTVTRGLDFTRL